MVCYVSLLVIFSLFLSRCDAGCSEVDSLTEAVAGQGFLLGCISCKRREEVSARATVDWHFKPLGEEEEEFRHDSANLWGQDSLFHKFQKLIVEKIFHYDHPSAKVLHENFSNRLEWHGTLDTDIQIGAVYIHNVSYNDMGMYRCTIHRTLFLPQYNEHVIVEKEVDLSVVPVANRELTSVIAEIMMFVLIVVLQLWLIIVMIYCYKKISEEHEAREARKALKTQAGLLESKDNCDGVQLE